ncbi:MAG TPA: ribosomal protein S18-alanine N-acetyltransferase [archaeon]|nr:ribosomal protein S18-alanine N-acetyltransferase [archaeon]
MMTATRRRARVRLRRMTSRDLKQVDAIEQVCFGADAWPRHAFRELLQVFRQAHPTRGGLWVAEDPGKGEVLGYAGIEVSALWGEADIINIAVALAHRRRGVGRMLLEWTIRRCRRSGIEMLWLRVRESNRSARRFYRVMGFEERGKFAGYYQDPDEPAILMAMDLA